MTTSPPANVAIPVPEIPSPLGSLPGIEQLPARPDLPDVLVADDGSAVSAERWPVRREEMKRTLEYYATGSAPPPPAAVKSQVIQSQPLADGKGTYRLVKLSFGPDDSLSLHVGIFTPAASGPVPAVIMIGGVPPGAPVLPRLPQGPTQGSSRDALSVVGSGSPATSPSASRPSTSRAARGRPQRTPDDIAASNAAFGRGYAYVVFDNNECGEDTTHRNPDGSWAFRNTRFPAAYPSCDWGLLRVWAWGASRVVDYLQTDPSIDARKLVITGVSRAGKAALVAGAFDERFAMVAPDASSGGGTPAYRFSGAEHGGKEGLTEMTTKYPNWFSPHLRQFRGHAEKLPFDEHWFIALCAPRPFIALEGDHDQNVNINGVRQSFRGAAPAYGLLNASERLGINWADRPHGMVKGDWDAMLAFADHFLLDKPVDRKFDQFPATQPAP